MTDPGTFSDILWFVILFPFALASIVVFLCVNAKRHIVDEPEEQREMVERFREAGG